MDKKLRESEQWLSMIWSSLGIAVMATDIQGYITLMNPHAEVLTGWMQAEILGRHVEEMLLVWHETSQVLVENPIVKVLQEGMPIDLADHRLVLIAKNGTEQLLDGSATPIKNDQGNIIGAALVFRDNAEHQRLQEQRIQAQKMEAIGRLAGGVAHEFSNLLMVISIYTELLLSGRNRRAQIEHNVAEVKKAVDNATALTSQLRVLSRKWIPQPQILELNTAIANMKEVLRRLLGQAIKLIIVPRATMGYVNIDPALFDQIIRILVMNARDSMPHGGTLIIETANVMWDELQARRYGEVQPGPYVMLAVRDTGGGIHATTRARLFEPFFTTKPGGQETGLELSLIYSIISQSGGHIEVDSALGRGTVFRVYLPRVERAAFVPEPSAVTMKLQQGSETVLLVEDEDEVRTAISESLQMCGYTVLKTRLGREALTICRRYKGPIHLLLTDVMMPRMTGPELAQRIFQLRPDIKVLYVSGYASGVLAQQNMMDLGTAFLQKPFTSDTLARQVRAVLDSALSS